MSTDTDTAYFRTDGDWIVGNGAARGPWSADACHAGPVTAVIARALEQVVADKQLTRLTINFCRPVPLAGFRVAPEIVRNGRAATSAVATLRDAQERICATASSVHLTTHDFAGIPTASIPHPIFNEARIDKFPLEEALHGLPFFGSSIEVAYPPGESGEPGPTTMWLRALPIVEGEAPSPFQVMCPISDCGNGISRNAEYSEISFVNADITVSAYRLPQSDWLASQAVSFWQPSGIGNSQAILFDPFGSIGMALQTLIVKPVN
jgi:acyl-coenzyme A thioesterase PaaI-like protein